MYNHFAASVESLFLSFQRFTPCQLSKDNGKPIVLPLFSMLLHAKDIWHNIHFFQRGFAGHLNERNLHVCYLFLHVSPKFLMLHLTEIWKKAFDKGKVVGILFIDFQ